MKALISFVLVCLSLSAEVLDFSLIKMPTLNALPPHVLLIGGIQGDEPGGFNALNLFLQHYKIKKGEVWVIPNLNPHSILQNHRGIYGDMNRKFKTLKTTDPEYETITRLKSIILDDRIDFIFHLHDGSGFYRQQFISSSLNPNCWGNSSIIDQQRLEGAKYGDLLQYSTSIIRHINNNALKALHFYHTRNTHTATEDKEMEKSLTFFAVRHIKGALANEASKNLPLNERVYYHLLAIEGMFHALGVQFERDFALNPKAVQGLIDDANARVQITPLITLPMIGLKKKITHFPLPSSSLREIPLKSNHYIMGMFKKNQEIFLKYGNRLITRFSPLYLEFSPSLIGLKFEIDGQQKEVEMGSIIKIKDYFKVLLPKDSPLRVNVIGFTAKNHSNEANLKVDLKSILKNYSIDKQEKQYRIEVYEEKKFMGMVIADFGK